MSTFDYFASYICNKNTLNYFINLLYFWKDKRCTNFFKFFKHFYPLNKRVGQKWPSCTHTLKVPKKKQYDILDYQQNFLKATIQHQWTLDIYIVNKTHSFIVTRKDDGFWKLPTLFLSRIDLSISSRRKLSLVWKIARLVYEEQRPLLRTMYAYVHTFHVSLVYLFCRACAACNAPRGNVISTITSRDHATTKARQKNVRVIYAKCEPRWPNNAGYRCCLRDRR